MQQNFIPCADGTEIEEGGYSGTRGDDGNWTLGRVGAGRLVGSMKGLSAPTMVRWHDGDETAVTTQMMQAIDQVVFRAVGNSYYWRAMGCDGLPGGVDRMVWDFGFNSGISRAGSQLQRVAGLTGRDVDGDVGAMTLEAVAAVPVKTILSFVTPAYAKALQKVVGLAAAAQDGILGAGTADAVTQTGKRDIALIYALASQQDAAYRSFKGFAVNGKGWLGRLERRTAASLLMAIAPAAAS